MKVLGVLDRYVLRQWLGTFFLSAVGIPAVAVLIQLADRFGKLTSKGVPMRDIFLGQLLVFPYQMSLLFPAAILFATVFTLNALGRHSELTAIKAGGVSFFRLILPMLALSTLAIPANFALQEVAAVSSARQRELHRDKPPTTEQSRVNAAFVSDNGWTLGAGYVQREPGLMRNVLLTLTVPATSGPQIIIKSDSAQWFPSKQHWLYHNGTTYVRGDSGTATTLRFATLNVRNIQDPPKALINEQKKAEEMGYLEFGGYLDQLRRSSIHPGQLEVDYYLKIALPVACLVVALFGAPLTVTSPRSGAALGLAMALGTTLVYLTGTQIMKAIGGKDIISPIVAAWSMNIFFGAVAIVLLLRVRS